MRSTHCYALLAAGVAVAVAAPAHAVDVERVQTEIGVYELLSVPIKPAPFELTDSREAGVRVRSSTTQKVTLEGFRLASATKSRGRIDIPAKADWSVIGEQLYVGMPGGIQIYGVPELNEVGRRSLGEIVTDATEGAVRAGERSAPAAVRRVTDGWYYDGSVYDNTGAKLRCLLYPRLAQLRRAGHMPVPQRNADLEKWPVTLGLDSGAVVLTGFPPSRDISDKIPARALDQSRRQGQIEHLRIDGDDCTFVVSRICLHLRVVKLDAEEAGLPAARRLAWDQPTFLLNELAVDTPHRFLDGPSQPVIVSFGDPQAADRDATDLNVEQQAQQFFGESLGQASLLASGDLEAAREGLRRYRDEAAAEFQRATGRPPRGIPIPIRVTARSTWTTPGLATAALAYWVWTEISEEQLLATRYQAVLDAELTARRKSVEKVRQQAISQQEARVQTALSGLLFVAGTGGCLLLFFYNRAHPPHRQRSNSPGT